MGFSRRRFIATFAALAALTPIVGCSAPAATPSPALVATEAAKPAAVATAKPTEPPRLTDAAKRTEVPKSPEAPKVAKPANPDLILSTTTSTQDSGLLDTLIPMFEKQTGYRVKPIAVGSGQAMTMGERGEADVLLVHAPDSEKIFMEKGHGVDRKLVMHNDFILIGPGDDPAKVKDEKSIGTALNKIADAKALFVSRGDNSGTDQLEKKFWKQFSIDTKGLSWYQQTGQGMGATLGIAAEKKGYTITDRATYLANEKKLNMPILVQGDKALLNIYHVITVDPKKSDKINAAGAKAFAEFMVAKDTQDTIGKFGIDKYGSALFFSDAGKKDDEVGG